MIFKNSSKKFPLIISSIILLLGGIIYTQVKTSATPSEFSLPIPFSVQAPNNNWDRNEDCEETSITMANAFLTKNRSDRLPANAAQESINTLKAWEEKNLGYNMNTGSEATTKMAEGAFGLKVKRIKDYTEQDLKKALLAEHPVLLPINARLLNNPKYKDSGPLYHMIVVIGYNQKGFIVHDPGTESGPDNIYSYTVLKEAAADWNQQKKSMEPQNKVALVLSK